MKVDATKMSIEQLKILAYDTIQSIGSQQHNLQVIETELQKRAMDEKTNTDAPDNISPQSE